MRICWAAASRTPSVPTGAAEAVEKTKPKLAAAMVPTSKDLIVHLLNAPPALVNAVPAEEVPVWLTFLCGARKFRTPAKSPQHLCLDVELAWAGWVSCKPELDLRRCWRRVTLRAAR